MSFPFDILHTEIVRIALESEKQRTAAKNELEQITDASKNTEPYETLIEKAFLHASSETQLESIGFRVGQVIAEKVSKETTKLTTELEVVKFICKEFWSAVFGKQVDNLRTNHQGVYVVQDNKFTTLKSFPEGPQFVKQSLHFLALPCGIIRGALATLGIQATVTPTIEAIPSTKFHIQISGK